MKRRTTAADTVALIFARAEPRKKWEKNASKGVSDEDVRYYSLLNSPLIQIKRFATVRDFLRHKVEKERATGEQRSLVGVDGGTKVLLSLLLHPPLPLPLTLPSQVFGAPNPIYGAAATHALRPDLCGYVALGAEDEGLPSALLEACDSLVMIPCLSASINVSCAFMAVLTTMQIVDHDAHARTGGSST